MAARRSGVDELAPFVLTNVEGLKGDSEEAGHGAYGVIYNVTVNGLRYVAKRLHKALVDKVRNSEDIKEKFRSECITLSRLKHPNVVHFIGVQYGRERSDLTLIMECLHYDLSSFLETRPQVPLPLKLSILLDVTYGLFYLHTHDPPIVHRDLTDGNVLVTTCGRAKLADLGMAKLLTPQAMMAVNKHTKVPGRLLYMPPETLTENPECTPKIDIFSFGHLSLFTINQEDPEVILELTKIPRATERKGGIQALKRRLALEKVGEGHCMHSLIIQCLHDKPTQRPDAVELTKKVQELCTKYPKTVEDVVTLDEKYTQQIETLTKKLEDVARERETLRGTLKETESKYQVQISALHNQTDSLREQVANLEGERNSLLQQLRSVKAERDDLKTKKDQLEKENLIMKQQEMKAMQKPQLLEAQMDEATCPKRGCRESRKEYSKLVAENTQLQKSLASVGRISEQVSATTSPTKKTRTDGPASSSTESKATDYSKMTVALLKRELQDKGLDTSGKKAELVARLQGSDSETDGTASSKKAEEDETTEEIKDESDFSKAMRALKSSHEPKKTASKKTKRRVDAQVPFSSSYTVVDDWDCMLNQTNIGQNNNKYYVIQLLTRNANYSVWTRWGRVGEPGHSAMKGPLSSFDAGEKEFKKKFSDKTKNKWEDRDSFVPVKGKYTLIEMDDDQDSQEAMEVESKLAALDEPDAPPTVVKPPTLDRPTQDLVKLIFDNDMFQEAMKSMEIDTKKMPLGKLSKPQIAKGFEALEAIEAALNDTAPRSKLAELTSKFYTIIPHNFGRRVPPVIGDHETLQKKFDMLLVLGDIEIAQGIEKDKDNEPIKAGGEVQNPLDVKYNLLKADLSHLSPACDEYKVIEKYLRATEPQWRKLGILDVWRVDRQGEHDRFKVHDGVDNRRLLWHGTNVAVVAAILKSGMRIMPHSGGRVGKGIYFASECSKSAGYVRCARNTGIMLLNEVALGKEHHITMDDHTLKAPPPDYDCVIAKGRTEPDPKHDTTITLDSKVVDVPQGKPIATKHSSSSFSQSEYLVYKEDQARIRYLLKLRF